jgi:hypothetical protein
MPFEGTNVSVGRGTEISILWLSLFTQNGFTPKPNFGAQNPVYNGVLCYGEDLST